MPDDLAIPCLLTLFQQLGVAPIIDASGRFVAVLMNGIETPFDVFLDAVLTP